MQDIRASTHWDPLPVGDCSDVELQAAALDRLQQYTVPRDSAVVAIYGESRLSRAIVGVLLQRLMWTVVNCSELHELEACVCRENDLCLVLVDQCIYTVGPTAVPERVRSCPRFSNAHLPIVLFSCNDANREGVWFGTQSELPSPASLYQAGYDLVITEIFDFTKARLLSDIFLTTMSRFPLLAAETTANHRRIRAVLAEVTDREFYHSLDFSEANDEGLGPAIPDDNFCSMGASPSVKNFFSKAQVEKVAQPAALDTNPAFVLLDARVGRVELQNGELRNIIAKQEADLKHCREVIDNYKIATKELVRDYEKTKAELANLRETQNTAEQVEAMARRAADFRKIKLLERELEETRRKLKLAEKESRRGDPRALAVEANSTGNTMFSVPSTTFTGSMLALDRLPLENEIKGHVVNIAEKTQKQLSELTAQLRAQRQRTSDLRAQVGALMNLNQRLEADLMTANDIDESTRLVLAAHQEKVRRANERYRASVGGPRRETRIRNLAILPALQYASLSGRPTIPFLKSRGRSPSLSWVSAVSDNHVQWRALLELAAGQTRTATVAGSATPQTAMVGGGVNLESLGKQLKGLGNTGTKAGANQGDYQRTDEMDAAKDIKDCVVASHFDPKAAKRQGEKMLDDLITAQRLCFDNIESRFDAEAVKNTEVITNLLKLVERLMDDRCDAATQARVDQLNERLADIDDEMTTELHAEHNVSRGALMKGLKHYADLYVQKEEVKQRLVSVLDAESTSGKKEKTWLLDHCAQLETQLSKVENREIIGKADYEEYAKVYNEYVKSKRRLTQYREHVPHHHHSWATDYVIHACHGIKGALRQLNNRVGRADSNGMASVLSSTLHSVTEEARIVARKAMDALKIDELVKYADAATLPDTMQLDDHGLPIHNKAMTYAWLCRFVEKKWNHGESTKLASVYLFHHMHLMRLLREVKARSLMNQVKIVDSVVMERLIRDDARKEADIAMIIGSDTALVSRFADYYETETKLMRSQVLARLKAKANNITRVAEVQTDPLLELAFNNVGASSTIANPGDGVSQAASDPLSRNRRTPQTSRGPARINYGAEDEADLPTSSTNVPQLPRPKIGPRVASNNRRTPKPATSEELKKETLRKRVKEQQAASFPVVSRPAIVAQLPTPPALDLDDKAEEPHLPPAPTESRQGVDIRDILQQYRQSAPSRGSSRVSSRPYSQQQWRMPAIK